MSAATGSESEAATPTDRIDPRLVAKRGTVGGEIRFRDVRGTASRSRRVAGVHRSGAVVEMLGADLDAACVRVATTDG